jgi:hypothetical protein
LADDVVVYVEELAQAVEWGSALAIRSVRRGVKCGLRCEGPRYDVALMVFAEDCYGTIER